MLSIGLKGLNSAEFLDCVMFFGLLDRSFLHLKISLVNTFTRKTTRRRTMPRRKVCKWPWVIGGSRNTERALSRNTIIDNS